MRNYLLTACLVALPLTANSALLERLGGLAYYDDVANLTWLADANYAQTSGYDADGQMTWDEASAWASELNVGGVTGWRLPNTIDVGNDGISYGGNQYHGIDAGFNITTHSELSNMFYNVLSNTAAYSTAGNYVSFRGPTEAGPFSNLQSSNYWSGTEYALSNLSAWFFSVNIGNQFYFNKTNNTYAWAVKSGDVNAVPIPAAAWLFVSGLIGLVGLAKRKKS